jgi:hypothetical protein
MDSPRPLTTCDDAERATALARFALIQPHLEANRILRTLAAPRRITLHVTLV